MQVLIDGRFVRKKDAKVSLSDYGYQYGYGLFETFRVFDGEVFLFRQHYQRLHKSAKKLKLLIPGYSSLKTMILKILEKNKLRNTILRLTVSKKPDGNSTISLVPRAIHANANVYQKGVKCGIKKIDIYNLWNFKTLCFLPYILARLEKGKLFDIIIINKENYVCEGSISSVFIVKNSKLITPPLSLGIIQGVTRDFIKKIAGRLKIKTLERLFTLRELMNSDECFLTNSTRGIVPVVIINDKRVGTGKVGNLTSVLMKAYKNELKNKKNFR